MRALLDHSMLSKLTGRATVNKQLTMARIYLLFTSLT